MPRKDKLRQEKVKIGQKNPKKIFVEFFGMKLRQKRVPYLSEMLGDY